MRVRHEHLLVARHGEIPLPNEEDLSDSAIEATRGLHSVKPEGCSKASWSAPTTWVVQ
jgi:hypothetical protein